ncbi:hypothetical protein SAICODRAFT_21090 [Saitoella complicata NRRL Y-17804]|uniref:DEK-C domain-containing protein n=1 Tax=Saitoella complicata (strain BCRC 22490 / CBS 7301 / JCM 7358 / NBRC 10748 / NRRL Y-17804) TaxID=698492 RepID=A0A0E9NP75_SAICN|nr:uncharacterized protein SAICODRAFT_21090 [Saitoella complicata NRRL Y-17804]ODQ51060.1 hypothetical protein SAICODRAFT_21090 [Saitoella complicata NRRL Y-17804]GAO51230.1 hypothetical protein G7K_5338-t1 [Saitoella complicata NRRL Y-17804]
MALTKRKVIETCKKVVRSSDLKVLTVKTARAQVAEELGVDLEELKSDQWKDIVKDAIHEEVDRLNDEPEEELGRESSQGPSPPPKMKSAKKAPKSPSPEPSPAPEDEDEDEDEEVKDVSDAESDMSSLIDEPMPTKKSRKRKSTSGSPSDSDDILNDAPKPKKKAAPKKEPVKRAKKDSKDSTPVDPEQEKVDNLKKIIVACGVRKQWVKEFADKPDLASQIKHCRKILSDLGMKGEPTISKAKTLREKREFDAEVQALQANKEGNEEEEEEEEEEDAPPRTRGSGKPPARRAAAPRISFAFLGDQSSDSE